MTAIDYLRYLAAKRSVDDHAINDGVYRRLGLGLSDYAPDQSLRVLEIGCGVGTMIERLIDWQLDGTRTASPRWRYTALDERPEHVRAVAARLAAIGSRDLHDWRPTASGGALTTPWETDEFLLVESSFDDWAKRQPEGSFDLVVACAVLDIVDVPRTLASIARLLAPDGWLWAPITFDGLTAFDPPIDPTLDDHIIAVYHQTMDDRRSRGGHGGSRVGRTLWRECAAAGLTPLAIGGSAWTIAPEDGQYGEDDAFFLHTMLDFIAQSVGATDRIPGESLTEWIDVRRQQINAGTLVFFAHNVDILAQKRAVRPSE